MGQTNTVSNSTTINQPTLSATEGATALDMNSVIQHDNDIEKKAEQQKAQNVQSKETEIVNEPSLENISMENAAYLQDMEDLSPFEVDSIELSTPELFSEKDNDNSFNQDIDNENEPEIFENSKIETKEPEMFEENNSEEDLEIPAFLRRQRN
tara:strand:- start:792 stop:1250 length:459 start_codon:yes stop_codon:yes gene_type:complete